MSRNSVGISLLVAGFAVAAVGVWGMVTGGDESEEEAVASTTTSPVVETTTTTSAPSTTSTTLPPTTTTTLATTTTTVDPASLVEAFVVEFAAAIAAQDVEFLFATLSPDVIELFGADVCQGFIEDEILLLEDYRVTGEVSRMADTGSGPADQFSAPVSFTFQGSDFEANAMFALDDGVRWFGECR